MERLQKVLAERGVASRRKSEELILAGRVKVDGKVITELGFKVGNKAQILVDGKEVFANEKKYYVLNKPEGYLTTLADPFKRRTIADLFSQKMKDERVYPIGRLDYESSGVILLTNDGTLANKLIKNNDNIEKIYHLRVFGIITQGIVEKLLKGIIIDDLLTKVSKIDNIKIDKKTNQSECQITIYDGKNRQIRNMISSLGLKIKWVKRLSYASITSDNLASGEIRPLKPHEIKKLYVL